jgi:serine/threonine protein phosphatase PrpC
MGDPRKSSVTLAFHGATDVGVVREANEDAFDAAEARTGIALMVPHVSTAVSVSPVLLAVSDGMGGANAGEVASALTLETLRTALARALLDRDPATALRAAVAEANEAVVTAAAASRARAGMGATLVALIVDHAHAFVTVIGDARAYLLRAGELTQVTKDQSFLQRLIDEGRMTPEMIAEFPHKNVILQAVGQAGDLMIPVGSIDLRRGDRILLCSDGLSGEVDAAQIREILLASHEPAGACASLIAAAKAHGGQDNITVIVATAEGDGLPDPGDEPISWTVSMPPTDGDAEHLVGPDDA